MSSELEQMTGAGGTIVLGGQTFLLKQLTLGDYGQIQAWLRQRLPRPFALVAEALKDLEPLRELDPDGYAEARKQLLLSAMEDVRSDAVGAPALIEQALNGPEGLSFVLWLCLRKNHPQVTAEQVASWVEQEDLALIKAKLDDITIFDTQEEDDGLAEGNPPRARRAGRKGRKARKG